MSDTTQPTTEETAQPDTAAAESKPSNESKPSTPETKPSTSLERELEETKDRLLRTLAEMENLRKRTEREVADARMYGISAFARDVLTVADNMHLALGALNTELREKSDATIKALLDGVELTERALMNALEKHGVKRLDPLGQKFDPHKHQAMFEKEDASVPAGHVAQVMQSGYLIGERVLRPALVAVSKGTPKTASANDNSGGK